MKELTSGPGRLCEALGNYAKRGQWAGFARSQIATATARRRNARRPRAGDALASASATPRSCPCALRLPGTALSPGRNPSTAKPCLQPLSRKSAPTSFHASHPSLKLQPHHFPVPAPGPRKDSLHVKITSLLPSAAAVALLAAAVLAATTGAQAPQTAPQNSSQGPPPADQAAPGVPHRALRRRASPGGRPMRNYPPPTNLQVLPKDLTGRQVRDIMETWAGSLGVNCEFCHTADPKNVGPNGRPRMNFADDSKPDKQIARHHVLHDAADEQGLHQQSDGSGQGRHGQAGDLRNLPSRPRDA